LNQRRRASGFTVRPPFNHSAPTRHHTSSNLPANLPHAIWLVLHGPNLNLRAGEPGLLWQPPALSRSISAWRSGRRRWGHTQLLQEQPGGRTGGPDPAGPGQSAGILDQCRRLHHTRSPCVNACWRSPLPFVDCTSAHPMPGKPFRTTTSTWRLWRWVWILAAFGPPATASPLDGLVDHLRRRLMNEAHCED